MGRVIFQVLGAPKYSEVSYVFEGEKIETKLSSFAVAQKYKNTKIVLFLPVSLLNKNILNEIELCSPLDCKTLISAIKEIEIDSNVVVYPLLSMGNYNGINFQAHPETISVQIFLVMLEEGKCFDEIILDISTGLNQYVSSLIEAGRAFLTYLKLEEPESAPSFALLSSDPIVGTKTTSSEKSPSSKMIYKIPFDVKAFFDLPLRKVPNFAEGEDRAKEKIGRFMGRFKGELTKFHTNFVRSFNALKYGVPLALFYESLAPISQNECELEEEFCGKLKEILKLKVSDNTAFIFDLKDLQFRLVSKEVFGMFFCFALQRRIKNLLRFVQRYIKKHTPEKDGVPMKEIEKFFEVFEELGFGLNSRFLERDLKEIRNTVSKVHPKNWIKLSEVGEKDSEKKEQKGSSREERRYQGDPKRNFFAHSGFEHKVVEVKEKDGEIYFRYVQEKMPEIKSWLQTPES